MEIQSNTTKEFYWVVAYAKSHIILSVLAFYYFASVALKAVFSIDILLPCLWKLIFHFQCPGCGLTSSFIHLLTLNFSAAYQDNPLIFILLPIGIIYLFIDFQKYKRRLMD